MNIVSCFKSAKVMVLVIVTILISSSAVGMDRSKLINEKNVMFGLLAGWTGVAAGSLKASQRLFGMSERSVHYKKPLLWAARASSGVSYASIMPLVCLVSFIPYYCLVVVPTEKIVMNQHLLGYAKQKNN